MRTRAPRITAAIVPPGSNEETEGGVVDFATKLVDMDVEVDEVDINDGVAVAFIKATGSKMKELAEGAAELKEE